MEAKTVNMNYRFTGNEEPTYEQLLVIMKEVEADACSQSEKISKSIIENIQKEYFNICKRFPHLAKDER